MRPIQEAWAVLKIEAVTLYRVHNALDDIARMVAEALIKIEEM